MTKNDVRRQQYARAAVALMTFGTLQEAADNLGVTVRTLQRWLKDDELVTMLHELADDVLSHSARRLATLTASAVEVLHQVADDVNNPAGVRARASDLILANALKYAEGVSLARRVANLEAQRNAKQEDTVTGGNADAETTTNEG